MDTWPRSNKISGGFRCLGAAAHYANIRSFISTTKNMATATARWPASQNSGDYASQIDFASCKSATKTRNARALSASSRMRSKYEGWMVTKTGVPSGRACPLPRKAAMTTVRPSRLCAAVAPSVTMTADPTSARSRSNHQRQRSISGSRGRTANSRTVSAADGSVLSFAGLLDRWRDPANGEFVTSGLVRDGLRRSMSGRQPHAALPSLLNERKPKHLFFDFRTRHQVDAATHHHLVNGVRVLLFQGAEIVPQHPVKLNGCNVERAVIRVHHALVRFPSPYVKGAQIHSDRRLGHRLEFARQ